MVPTFWKMHKRLYLLIKVSCIVAIIQSKYDLIRIPGSNLWIECGSKVSLFLPDYLPAVRKAPHWDKGNNPKLGLNIINLMF